MARFKSVPTAISLLALFVALGGTAVAAKHYIITSSSQVKNGALTAADLSGGARRTLRGARGPAGPGGPQGPAGPAGVASVSQWDGGSAFLPANDVASSQAFCPPGTVVTGGGWDGETAPPISATVAYNEPIGQSWAVIMVDNSGFSSSFHAVAVCAGGGGVTAARSHSRERRLLERKVAQLKARR